MPVPFTAFHMILWYKFEKKKCLTTLDSLIGNQNKFRSLNIVNTTKDVFTPPCQNVNIINLVIKERKNFYAQLFAYLKKKKIYKFLYFFMFIISLIMPFVILKWDTHPQWPGSYLSLFSF